MVVLSVSIVAKSGEVLLARQYVDISKQRIDGYLTSFPKLIDVSNQHTVIDTENVRFLYQSINQSSHQYADPAAVSTADQGVWVVLLTNKQSNIMEDLETLQSVIKLLPEYCMTNSSHHTIDVTIKQHVFELIFALDELIGHGGLKEYQSLQQIKVFTDMESHEEKLQLIIQQSKMQEAKIEASRKAESIERSREQQKRLNQSVGGSSNDRYGSNESNYSSSQDEYRPSQPASSPVEKVTPQSISQPINQPIKRGGGMQLGMKGKTGDSFLDQLSKEEKLAPVVRETTSQSLSSSSNQSVNQSTPQYGVSVIARERLSVEVDRDGSYESVLISGEMKCCVYDPADSKVQVHIGMNPSISQSIEQLGYKLQLHPKMDKKLWASQKILALSDPQKGLPIGSDSAPVILKWRKQGQESDVPFTLTFWPNPESNQMAVNVEYSYQSINELDCQDVYIRIPVEGMPDVSQIIGDWKYDQRAKILVWHIPLINAENHTGSLDFTCTSADYPIHIEFTSPALLSGLNIENVTDATDEKRQINYQVIHKLEVDKFVIG